jgi:ATP-dependent helicase/DNAse subunit B
MLARMPLKLIVGPPNSGRAGEIVAGFRSRLGDDPVLVVPTLDDADAFERELAAGGDTAGFVGGAVLNFQRLVEEITCDYEIEAPPRLSQVQRVWLARVVAADAGPLLRSSASGRGFAPALADLIDELAAANVDPETLAARAAELDDGDYERQVAALYRSWSELRDRLGRGDAHQITARATAALLSEPEAWSRPVFIYGFDDLTHEQLELVRALAGATEVTLAAVHEDRDALAARSRLLAELRDEADLEILPVDETYTDSPALFALDRNFLEPGSTAVEPGEDVELLEAAGERAEAELVASKVARLLADDVGPDQIAIVVRRPAPSGALWEQVLTDAGIPASVDGRVPFAQTATGRALAAALRASLLDGEASDVLALLRAPSRARHDSVDWLEREIRRKRMRSADEALAALERRQDWRPDELAELRDARRGAPLLKRTARLARELAERPHRRSADVATREQTIELRAAAAAERALLDVAELGAAAEDVGAAEVLELLDGVSTPLHRGASAGRVRVCSPYRIRAGRVRHLFVASLQEGEFPRIDTGPPLLSDENRNRLALPDRIKAVDEERYLFAVCLSRPTERLYLSWRFSDDEGRPLGRSPFVDEVRDLLLPAPPANPEHADPLLAGPDHRRELADVTLPLADASQQRELARAVACGGERWRERLEAVTAPDDVRIPVEELLIGAQTRIAEPLRRPRGIDNEYVRSLLGGRRLFGASTLEGFGICSYRWFVDHELEPQSLEPIDEPLAHGSLIHDVLEALFSEGAGGTHVPTADTLSAWQARGAQLLAEKAAERGLDGPDATARAALARIGGLLSLHLAEEAEAGLALEPSLFEAGFGDIADEQNPLELDNFAIHGRIDRIDVGPETSEGRRLALIHDYKLSGKAVGASQLDGERKLQLQLYMLAARALFDLEPAGALYWPLAANRDRRPRGLFREELRDGVLKGLRVGRDDWLDKDAIAEHLEAARARSAEFVKRMRTGDIDRDPIDGKCPRYCSFQAICRKERGVIEEDPAAVLDEEEEPE